MSCQAESQLQNELRCICGFVETLPASYAGLEFRNPKVLTGNATKVFPSLPG